MALHPNVVAFADNHFDCRHLLQRSVVHHGTDNATATIKTTMSRERVSGCGTWHIGWPVPGNIDTVRLSNGNCGRLGIPKRPTYYVASEPVKDWTAYVPKLAMDWSAP